MKMYVLQVIAGKEFDIKKELFQKGYDALLPTMIKLERSGGKWLQKERIIIPGYIFVELNKLTDDCYYSIKQISGVLRFLGDNKPVPISEQEADFIKLLYNNNKPLPPTVMYLDKDNHITNIINPFKGNNCVFTGTSKHKKSSNLSINLFGINHKIKVSVNFLKS